jgi:hypothetical protein
VAQVNCAHSFDAAEHGANDELHAIVEALVNEEEGSVAARADEIVLSELDNLMRHSGT